MWIKNQFGRVIDLQKSYLIQPEKYFQNEFMVYAYFLCYYKFAGEGDDIQEKIGLSVFSTEGEANEYVDELLVGLQAKEKNITPRTT